MRLTTGAIFVALATLLLATSAGAATSPDVTRGEYIRAVEPVCAKDTRQNTRILKGVRQQIFRGEYGPAARKFTRATKAFTGTLRRVVRVPRPQSDARMLVEWLTHMIKQRSYLAQITMSLRQRNGFKAQRLSVHLMSNARQANDVVSDFGFRNCILKPEQFM